MADKEFDPSDHLIELGRKQYLPVAWRIYWLREKHPEAQLETQLIENSDKHAIFKAHVFVPGKGADGIGAASGEQGASATGYGSETQADFGDFLEKAETKAIGRALAALGFGTQFCDDFEEGDSVTDAPIQRRPPAKRGVAPPPAQSYEGHRAAGTTDAGKARSDLRKALAVKFGPDEKATFEHMKQVEPGCIFGTTIDFSVITPERCKEIIAITEPQA